MQITKLRLVLTAASLVVVAVGFQNCGRFTPLSVNTSFSNDLDSVLGASSESAEVSFESTAVCSGPGTPYGWLPADLVTEQVKVYVIGQYKNSNQGRILCDYVDAEIINKLKSGNFDINVCGAALAASKTNLFADSYKIVVTEPKRITAENMVKELNLSGYHFTVADYNELLLKTEAFDLLRGGGQVSLKNGAVDKAQTFPISPYMTKPYPIVYSVSPDATYSNCGGDTAKAQILSYCRLGSYSSAQAVLENPESGFCFTKDSYPYTQFF